jgi:sugar transferase (PEP-CTERM/EpsH1 system associated)
VDLVCFARDMRESADALALRDICASVFVEILPSVRRTVFSLARFGAGACLSSSYYSSNAMRRHVSGLRVAAAVSYCSVMGLYAPSGVPLITDMVDLDSEKWNQYGDSRFPAWAYRLEAARVRRLERKVARGSRQTFFTTQREVDLFRSVIGNFSAGYFENGVDVGYFDPAATGGIPEVESQPSLVFTGEMNYFPNVAAARWFALECLPRLRARNPATQFWVVGRNPAASVRRLAALPGVHVTGAVPDVRPYLRSARATVAPIALARGIQNKVLEALSMGKMVFGSPEICQTLAPEQPPGVVCCASPEEYASSLQPLLAMEPQARARIREAARTRFCWDRNVQVLLDSVDEAVLQRSPAAVRPGVR